MKSPILGASYTASSTNAAADRCVNLYPELVKQGGKERGFLGRSPGLRTLATIGEGPCRGMWVFDGNLFVVSGIEFYKVSPDYSSEFLGYIYGSDIVSMADNGVHIFIAANIGSYICDGDTLTKITDEDFPGASSVGFIDGYFVFIEPNSQKHWVTAIYDGSDIDALEYASAEALPDKIVGLAIDHREVWFLGESSCEVWYDSGANDYPLARMQGAFVEMGCAASRSVAKLDNSIFWLASDARGGGIVLRSSGYNGQRISNHGVEAAIASYSTISDAEAFTYRQAGHSFYVLSFPTADKTWVYDVATEEWCERASYEGGLVRWRARGFAHFNGVLVVGDAFSGRIYAIDQSVYAEGTTEQPWLRAWRALPPGQAPAARVVHSALQLDVETGVGLNLGQGSDPIVALRWSDDGGHTWSKYHEKKMGKIGEYRYRTVWTRLGATSKTGDRIYEVSGSDPVKIAIMGADLKLSGSR